MKYKAEIAMAVAEELVELLEPDCQWVEIVGSLRRKKDMVGDIEFLCIPRFVQISVDLIGDKNMDLLNRGIEKLIMLGTLDYRWNKRGHITYGKKNKLLRHVSSGIPLDIFSTNEECWPVALVVRTGSKESNIKIAQAAIERGMKFHAYGSGYTKEDGSKIICTSERQVFETVGLRYLEPEER